MGVKSDAEFSKNNIKSEWASIEVSVKLYVVGQLLTTNGLLLLLIVAKIAILSMSQWVITAGSRLKPENFR